MKLLPTIALLCGSLCLPGLGAAADYPVNPVRLVVAFPPGGGTDGAARIVSGPLAAELGQSVVIENRAGAGGTIGAQSVARATPDGYTLLFGTGAELLINPLTRRNAPYELLRDFTPITDAGSVSFVLVVPAASPIGSLKELVAHSSAKPDTLKFSSFGIGSTNHLMGELFLSATGVKALHVPYRGSQPAMSALLAGEVDFAFETAAVALPQVRAGKLKALATPSPQRLQDLPEVPTMEQSGFQGLTAEGWMGVFAPAGTPAPVVQRLNEALLKVLGTAEVRQQFAARGVTVGGNSPEAYRAKLAAEHEKWHQVVQTAGVSLDE